MAPKPEIIAAELAHVERIAEHIRPGDRAELSAMGRTPRAALLSSLRISRQAWTGTIDGVPVCMFGVAPAGVLTPSKGRPWMLGTAELDRHAILFLRRCRPEVEKMRAIFPQLENYVAASNAMAIHWLRWLGFSIEDARPMGAHGIPFHRFSMGGKANDSQGRERALANGGACGEGCA